MRHWNHWSIVTALALLLVRRQEIAVTAAQIRVPATPLWVHSPYVNWLLPADNATDDWVWHVRNDKVGSMTALVRINGVAFSILGPLHKECPQGLSNLRVPPLAQLGPPLVLPTRTVYMYAGGGAQLNLTFASPKFAADLSSYAPVALVEVSAASIDAKLVRLEVFFEVAGQIAVDADDHLVNWSTVALPDMPSGAEVMRIGAASPIPLGVYSPFDPATLSGGQPYEHLDWGAAHLVALPTQSAPPRIWMGSSNIARASFAQTGEVPTTPHESVMPVPACRPVGQKAGICRCVPGGRGAANDWPSLTVSWSLLAGGHPQAAPVTASAVLAFDDSSKSAKFFGVDLGEYWRTTSSGGFDGLLARTAQNFTSLMQQCIGFDQALVETMTAVGGPSYAAVGAVSYRQVLGDNSLVWWPGSDGVAGTNPAPWMFVKGLGSSGDTGTIDDNYPAALFYLYFQPDLLNALLRPVNTFMANHTYQGPHSGWPHNMTWPFNYSIHYLGQYPVADLQCWPNVEPIGCLEHGNCVVQACEGMPLEMTADQLQMSTAAAIVSQDFSTVEEFWPIFAMYAEYLVENTLDPTWQLCSDDFLGPSAHNANLAVKGILGIAAFATLCDHTHRDCGGRFRSIAQSYAARWVTLAQGGASGSSVREYNVTGSWSQKYNLVWDRVFGFGLFDAAIERECTLYLESNTTSVRREFGWYLDDRSAGDKRHLTNAGWAEWTAAMCGQPAVEDLYDRIVRFLEGTPDRWAFTDYYNADTADRIAFEGRAQMGGFAASLLLHKYKAGIAPWPK